MKIIQVHNYYQQAGGEDAVVEAERHMLEEHGHQIITFYKTNDLIAGGQKSEDGGRKSAISHQSSVFSLLRVGANTLWNHSTYKEFRALLKCEHPDIVHCHNTFPLISPSIYWACAKEKVPVVQTLHNYRLLCLNAFLFRAIKEKVEPRNTQSTRKGGDELTAKHKDNISKESSVYSVSSVVDKSSSGSGTCELCVKKSFKWPGVRYRCYRDSLAGSLVVALMLFVHKLIGTWTKKVTAYIALTEFQKQKMIEGGLPEHKIWVKPNFIEEGIGLSALGFRDEEGGTVEEESYPKPKVQGLSPSPYALFVGRLSPEKGCDVLIRAWGKFQEKLQANSCELSSKETPQLLIVGDGPELPSLENLSSVLCPPSSIYFLGQQPKNEVLSLMRNAQFLVLPSVWYEGFPMTIVEAFSCGTAVVASADGGMKEIIIEQKNGLKFEMGDSNQLAKKIEWAFSHSEQMQKMGRTARTEFEQKYSNEVNYGMLMEIYEQALGVRL